MATMPKRRKSKDNPYVLNYNEKEHSYIVSFKDNKNNVHKVEVSEKVFGAFDKFELEDISQMHEYERHIEHNEVFEYTLNNRAVDKPVGIEEQVENKFIAEELLLAINKLPEVQKRRLKKYFFENMTMIEIAKQEGCSKVAVKHSIDDGIENLKKNLKN